jgi:hypothetical protein
VEQLRAVWIGSIVQTGPCVGIASEDHDQGWKRFFAALDLEFSPPARSGPACGASDWRKQDVAEHVKDGTPPVLKPKQCPELCRQLEPHSTLGLVNLALRRTINWSRPKQISAIFSSAL